MSRFAEISRKREPNAAGPIIMSREVATLVHLIESSKPEVRAEGIRLIAAGGALTPRGATLLASVAIDFNSSYLSALNSYPKTGLYR